MQQQFTGLTMPVFTAFGWAEEEQALQFALSQLEQFINSLHAALPRGVQNHLPFFGLDQDSHVAYLAANEELEKDVYVAFITRPGSLEIQLAVVDEMAIGRGLKAAAAAPQRWLELLQDMEGDWSLHVKQMEVDEETGERSSHQEIFQGDVQELDEETAESLTSRANFLNGEPHWVTPVMISRRHPAEQVAAMGTNVVSVMADQIGEMLPLLEFMMGKTAKPVEKKKTKPKETAKVAQPARKRAEDADPDDQFVYVATLKPLHIRRGFVNLTPEHWDFFAERARATMRDITVAFEDRLDKDSSVWRLSSNDMARIVLSDTVRDWLEETFAPDEEVQVVATKLEDEEIEVILEPAE
jgi:hypothetical protein